MGNFSNNAITDVGKMLLADVQAGAVFVATRIVLGSGSMPGGATAQAMTDVITPVTSFSINKKKRTPDGKCIFGGVYSNAQVTQAFYFRELALYAKAVYLNEDGTVKSEGEEILYSYGNAGETADYMPAYSTSTVVEKQIDLVTWVGNDAQVLLNVESGVFLTQEQAALNFGHISPDTVGFDTLLEYMVSIYEQNLIVCGHISGFSDMPPDVTAMHGFISVVGGMLTVYGNARTAYYYRGTNSLTEWTSDWRKVYDSVNKPTPADVGAVSTGGDTMTGDLVINKAISAVKLKTPLGTTHIFKNANAANDLGTTISDEAANGATDRLNLLTSRTLADKLRLVTNDGKIYNILHTGNKELIKPADIGAVNKDGDTMAGNLGISKQTAPTMYLTEQATGAGAQVQIWNNQLYIANRPVATDDSNYRTLYISNHKDQDNVAYALRLSDVRNGVANYYTVLHTGNLSTFGLAAVPASVE